MKRAKILANISNLLVTVFLLVMIPCTIIGTYVIVVKNDDIIKNTRFRIQTEQTIDSLRVQNRIEKRINKMYRSEMKEEAVEDINTGL